jgi:hypothetical protein
MRQLNRIERTATAKGTNVPKTTAVAVVVILLGFFGGCLRMEQFRS